MKLKDKLAIEEQNVKQLQKALATVTIAYKGQRKCIEETKKILSELGCKKCKKYLLNWQFPKTGTCTLMEHRIPVDCPTQLELQRLLVILGEQSVPTKDAKPLEFAPGLSIGLQSGNTAKKTAKERDKDA